jgi:hypothetical protein
MVDTKMIYEKFIIMNACDKSYIPEEYYNNISLSYNGEKFIFKWAGETPPFISHIPYSEGPYNYEILHTILEQKEWFGPDGK